MIKSGNYTSIYLDFKLNCIHLYNFNNKHIVHDTRKIVEKPFTAEYYAKFSEALKDMTSRFAPAPAANTTIVFPDSVVSQNVVSFPSLKSKDISKPLDIYLNNTYKNIKDLNLKTKKIVSNKQYITVLLTSILNDVIGNIKVACTNAKIIPGNFTFASNATICGINDLVDKFHGQTFMFMDVKENSTKYVLVYKGQSVGYFDLPIGYCSLQPKEVVAEDVLLYAPHAELLVLNAKEKARQKALTLSGENNSDLNDNNDIDIGADENEDEENPFAGFDTMTVNRQVETVVKTLPKKQARKLPKFMQREIPQDDEGKVYESFRIFVRWALEILKGNDILNSFSKPNTIYVNLPKDYNYLFDKVNAEQEENGYKFVPAGLNKEKEDIIENLEMYGGLISKDSKKSTMF